MYTVIGYGGTRAFRVLWMLEELDLPYRHDRVMPFSDRARALTPGGRVPALVLPDGRMLMDSTAILNFLADCHDALTFPAGTVRRARQDAVIHRVLELIDLPMMTWSLMIQGIGPPLEPAVRDWVRGRLEDGMSLVAEALDGGPWVSGDSFTIADIVLGHCLHWAERYETPATDPRLRSYLARIEDRPAYRTADSL